MSHDSDDKTFPYQKDDAELRRRLTPMQYEVTQHAATERAFTGEYTDTEDDGIYKCVVCSTPLFESGAKFHSGCGWPSYFKPLNGEVIDERSTTRTGWCASRCAATTAARISATSSRTARATRPVCGTASIRLR